MKNPIWNSLKTSNCTVVFTSYILLPNSLKTKKQTYFQININIFTTFIILKVGVKIYKSSIDFTQVDPLTINI